MVLGALARLGVGLVLTSPVRVLRGAGVVVRTAVDVAGEAATIGVGVAGAGARATTEAARSVTGVVRRVVAVGAAHWQEGQRFHLPLSVPDAGMARGAQQAMKKVVAGVLEHPDVLVAYWDGGLGRLVVQVAEDAVTDRVVEAATSLAARHGLAARPAEAEEIPHPGGVGEVRAAAVALAVDAAGVAGALTARMVRLRRPPPMAVAALTLLQEDPRLRSVLRSALSKTTADFVLAVASAAVYSVDQSPTELVLDAVLRASQLAEAVARVVAFDAAHDQLCVPERISSASASTAPVRRPAPVDPLGDYAVKAITGSVVGAVATLLLRKNLQEASAAVLAGSPKPARYGWAAYQAALGCALAREAVLVRDGERLRLLQVVDTVVVHSSALSVQGHEPDPLAGAVVDAAQQAGLRVVVVGDPAVGAPVELADEIVGSDQSMSQVVSALQDAGHVVLTIARLSTRRQQDGLHAVTDPEVVAGLLRGDLAVTLADEGSAVLWAADLVCVRGL
ncbi:MAG: cation-translocating P-type ATPase, partial [Pseudonocardiaceae bacterium]